MLMLCGPPSLDLDDRLAAHFIHGFMPDSCAVPVAQRHPLRKGDALPTELHEAADAGVQILHVPRVHIRWLVLHVFHPAWGILPVDLAIEPQRALLGQVEQPTS